MISYEEELRSTLAEHAAAAPPGHGLLAGAKARSRRRLVRRNAAVAGVAVLAVGAGAAGLPALLDRSGGASFSPGGPGSVAGAPAGSPSQPGPLTFLPGAPEVPAFPYTPGSEPQGAGQRQIFITPDTASMQYYNPARPERSLTLTVSAQRPAREQPGAGTPVTVRGAAGVLYSEEVVPGQVIVTLVWPEDGAFVSVIGAGFPQADLLKYAERLTREPLVSERWFTFQSRPVGLTLAAVAPGEVGFAPEGGPSDGENWVSVAVRESTQPAGPAQLSTAEERRIVTKPLGGGRALVVSARISLGAADADLVAFADGIRVVHAGLGGNG